MERPTDTVTTEQDIDSALARARDFEAFPRILDAIFHPEPGLRFLELRLDDGRRLLIPHEELSELKDATDVQAMDLTILPQARSIWWRQLDDGLYLPDFLEYRWGKPRSAAA